MTGLSVYVYRRSAGRQDCTLGGISGRFDCLTLTGLPWAEQPPFQVTARRPEVRLVKRGEHWLAVPVNDAGEPLVGGSFGGNFVYTSDSLLPGGLPIPVHDRFEGGQS